VPCIGKNHVAHANEFAKSGCDSSARSAAEAVPDAPIMFIRAPTALNGPDDDVVVPWNLTQQVDYEGGLAVVIGRPGRFITRERAFEHVFA